MMVWLGAAAAFAVHVAIAVSVGVALFIVLPHRAVEAVVAVIFLAGAGLAIREARRERNTRTARNVSRPPAPPGTGRRL